MTNYYIYAARFQPFHNDHLRMVDWFLREYPGETLTLAIVCKAGDTAKYESPFQIKSNENFAKDRNPFDPIEVLSMTSCFASKYSPGNLLATCVPPPSQELGRKVVQSFFPGDRFWLVPRREEEWDELKVGAYLEMGDKVLRVDCPRRTSGWDLRNFIQEKNYTKLRNNIPEEILNIMKKKI